MFARTAKITAALIGITTALALLSVAQTVAWATYQGRRLPWGLVIVGRLFDWYTCLIFLPLLYWLVRRLQTIRGLWPPTISVLLLARIVVTLATYGIILPLHHWISANDP